MSDTPYSFRDDKDLSGIKQKCQGHYKSFKGVIELLVPPQSCQGRHRSVVDKTNELGVTKNFRTPYICLDLQLKIRLITLRSPKACPTNYRLVEDTKDM